MAEFQIKRVFYHDIESMYAELYEKAFGEKPLETQIPSLVYLGYSGKEYVGMVTGYIHTSDCLYIQMAAFTEKFRGYKAVGLFKKVIEFIHGDFETIIFRVLNTNFPAIKMALSIKMLIVGIRIIQNYVFVEFLSKENENG